LPSLERAPAADERGPAPGELEGRRGPPSPREDSRARAGQCRGPRAADSAVPQRRLFGLGQRPMVSADRTAFLVSGGFADGPPAAARFAAVGEPVRLSLSQRTRPDRGTSAVAGAGGIASAP